MTTDERNSGYIEKIEYKKLNDWILSKTSEQPLHYGSISTPHQIFELAKKLNEIIEVLNNNHKR